MYLHKLYSAHIIPALLALQKEMQFGRYVLFFLFYSLVLGALVPLLATCTPLRSGINFNVFKKHKKTERGERGTSVCE